MKRGLVAGTFDLCHAGHVLLLEECKNHCDELLVALHVDPSKERVYKHKPIQSVFERVTILTSNRDVNSIIPYETEFDLETMILNYDIDIYFLGEEYKEKTFTGKNVCQEKKIEVVFIPRDHTFSSTELRQRIYYAEKQLIGA